MTKEQFRETLLKRGFKQTSEYEFEKDFNGTILYVTEIDYDYWVEIKLPPDLQGNQLDSLSFAFYNEYEKGLEFLTRVEKIRSKI